MRGPSPAAPIAARRFEIERAGKAEGRGTLSANFAGLIVEDEGAASAQPRLARWLTPSSISASGTATVRCSP